MIVWRLARLIAVVSVVLVGACRGQKKQESVAPAGAPAALGDNGCVGAVVAGEPRRLELNGATWALAGSTMTLETLPRGETFAVGVLTDIKEDSPENKANLARFARWFVEGGAQLVLVAGDSGLDADQVVGALSVVAETKLPVFVIIGNREGRGFYGAAMARLAQKYDNVFDLDVVRRIDTPAVEILSMPGYFDAAHIHAADGCRYRPEDVRALGALARASRSPTLLVSHGPPRQSGALALDRTSEGENVGDPDLTAALRDFGIPFGVFGNIHEAGGRATSLAGDRVIPQGEYVDSLYLHPGAADAVRWMMNGGGASVGMAGLVTFRAGRAKYDILRLADAGATAERGQKKGE